MMDDIVIGQYVQPHSAISSTTSYPCVVVNSCASQLGALQVVLVPTPSNANGGIVALAGLAAETPPTISNNRIAQTIFARVVKPAVLGSSTVRLLSVS